MKQSTSIDNIYQLDGKAISFGLQHILAMFVANIEAIIIVTRAKGLM